jgi:hypothetical protein
MTTPDEIARKIILAAKTGDGLTNTQAYAEVLLCRWREEIRQEEISHCAKLWRETLKQDLARESDAERREVQAEGMER